MAGKICCMFSDPDANHAIKSKELTLLAEETHLQKAYSVYKCNKCGAFVLCQYEEHMSADNSGSTDMTMEYVPVEEPQVEDGQFPGFVVAVKDAPRISTLYREEDSGMPKKWHIKKPEKSKQGVLITAWNEKENVNMWKKP